MTLPVFILYLLNNVNHFNVVLETFLFHHNTVYRYSKPCLPEIKKYVVCST